MLRGDIRRLIVTVPPRSLKSICASVAFPAFALIDAWRAGEPACACHRDFRGVDAAASLKPVPRIIPPSTRLAGGLTRRQVELMDRWGYPYVFDPYRFHMTLTGALAAEELARIAPLLSYAFRDLAGHIAELDAVSLMRQDNRKSRFRVYVRRRLAR